MEYLSIIAGKSGEAALAALVRARGPFNDAGKPPEALIADRIGKVPNLLIDFWRFIGTGSLDADKFWFPQPDAMVSVMDLLFRNDPDFKQDTHVVAYGAMGNLLCWNTRHGIVTLTSQGGFAQAPGLFNKQARKPADEALLEVLEKMDPFFFDAVDSGNEPMLKKVLKALRPLEAGEVFAVLPVRAAAGPIVASNVEIMPLVDHWTNIALNQKFMLHDVEGGKFNLREIRGVAK